MHIKIASFILLVFLIEFTLVASYALFSKNNTEIISPLPQKTYAKASEPTVTLRPTHTPTRTATPTPIPPTQTPTPTPIIITSVELDELFTKYSSEYSVDKELLKRVAKCESGLNPNAATSLYAGLYQFSESLWLSTRTLMGQDRDPNLRFNPEEAIRTAAFMVFQGHLGIWPNCNK